MPSRPEKAHAQGVQALEAEDPDEAVRRFDEANLQASKVIDEVQEESKGKNQSDEAVKRRLELFGRANWLKTRALRDRAVARALQDGKPLPELYDASTGEMFYSVWQIPEKGTRDEALDCLRQAAFRLLEDAEVQKETLRAELMAESAGYRRNWTRVERLSRNLLALKADLLRVNVQLAQFELEQPQTGPKATSSAPLPPEKRSRKRVLEARKHLDEAKRAPQHELSRWRILHLEAQVARWLRDDYARKGEDEKQRKEEQLLRKLLLDAQDGALVRAEYDKNIADDKGVEAPAALGLHQLAVELRVEDARRKTATVTDVLKTLNVALAFYGRIAHDKAPAARVGECATTAVTCAVLARPYLGEPAPERWASQLEAVQALARKAVARKAAQPSLFAEVSRLLTREAALADKYADKQTGKKLRDQAARWVDEGLAAAEAAKLSPAETVELHGLAAERKALAGGKRDAYAMHLKSLEQSKVPQTQALVEFLEGIAAEREGKLDKARKHLEKSLAQATAPGAALRINLVLANVYLALGQPVKALAGLNSVDKAYADLDKLSDQEKAWVLEFLKSREELDYLLLIANLGAAREKAVQYLKDHPGEKVPEERLKGHEESAKQFVKKLPAQSLRKEVARATLVSYYARTGRPERAKEELTVARKDYPDNLELLQLDVALQEVTTAGKTDPKKLADADQLIQRFLVDHPRDQKARLFWASWLTRTERADKAVTYLEDPTNFPALKDDSYKRALAQALVGKGDREGGARLLASLPHDPALDDAMIRLASTTQEKEKQVTAALARYERNELFRCWNAILDLNNRKYVEAIEGFFQALEYSRVRSLAEAGLWEAFAGLAEQDPAQTKARALTMMQEAPDEKTPYLAYAYACLKLDELGEPGDAWERTKNMTTALNSWEKLSLNENQDRSNGALMKARFWNQARRPDRARTEVLRALAQSPRRASVLAAAVELCADSEEPEQWEQGRKYLATLNEVQPQGARPLFLAARLEERAGKPAEAIKAAESLLEKYPDEALGYEILLRLLDRQGEKKRAGEWVARWRKRSPDSLGAASAAVYFFAVEKKSDLAQEAARHFVEEQEEKLLAKLRATPRPEAPADWEKQQRARWEQRRVDIELQLTRRLLAGGAHTEAERWLRRLLDRYPDRTDVQILLADLAARRKDWGQARDRYRAVLNKDPRHTVAANNLAYILAKELGDAKEAYRLAQEMRKGRFSQKPLPGDRLSASFLDTLGVVYRKLNDPSKLEEMRDLFEAGRQQHARDPRMYLYLGHAYAGLGKPDKARELFDAAIALAGPAAKTSLGAADRQKVIKQAQAAQKGLK
ncbi:MAG: tetratricopeptide repeat protein [Planctomycetes bacterium]|nr:tetratricopeptide repeat protein [Planctomycetota bacterium]